MSQDELHDPFTSLNADMSEEAIHAAAKLFCSNEPAPQANAPKALAEAITKLQALERVAFALDDESEKDAARRNFANTPDGECAVRLAAFVNGNPDAILAPRCS